MSAAQSIHPGSILRPSWLEAGSNLACGKTEDYFVTIRFLCLLSPLLSKRKLTRKPCLSKKNQVQYSMEFTR
jgi:hypothetical protein